MQNINNYDTYTNGMKKSYQDKLFFLDKIDESKVNSLIDFGCADGSLIKHIKENVSNMELIGYDIDKRMIELAQCNCDCTFSTNFEWCVNKIIPKETVLNLSNVLHEVYSYSTFEEIELFWERVFDSGFKYIAIRDLCASESMNRPSNINDVTKVIQKANPAHLADYESIWGSVRENRNLVHFLMKYRYVENWEREVRENYFPLSLERLLSKIPTEIYEIVYFENYTLPFTEDKIKEDFGIELHDNTHVKLLLKKK